MPMLVAAPSFLASPLAIKLEVAMTSSGMEWAGIERVRGEPSPERVDALSSAFAESRADSIVAIGGGSVLDAAKACAAAGAHGCPSRELLEGMGSVQPDGRVLPWFAVPTTAGTGSEATWNAVLSSRHGDPFKKSLRHPDYPALTAFLDPDASASLDPIQALACALDALAQLIEPFGGSDATAFSDQWCESGLRAAKIALKPLADAARFAAGTEGADRPAPSLDTEERQAMLYAAFCSGVALAHGGIGIAHGIAGPLGAWTRVPHAIAIGRLLPLELRYVLSSGRELPPESFSRHARVARLLSLADARTPDEEAFEALAAAVESWATPLPGFSAWEPTTSELDEAAKRSQARSTPLPLPARDARAMLEACL